MDGLRRALLGVPRQVDPRSGSPRFGGLGDWGIGGEGALEMSGCFSMMSMVVLLELFGQSCWLPIWNGWQERKINAVNVMIEARGYFGGET